MFNRLNKNIINPKRDTFYEFRIHFVFVFILFLVPTFTYSQTIIKGIVTEADSVTPMPFVYVINGQTGLGQMSDASGKFTIQANDKDSIIFSYVGYSRLKVSAQKLMNKVSFKEVKVIMKPQAYNLNQVVVSDFKLKPYERDYMKRIINTSKTSVVNAMESPISALYMQFSKKGKEQRKLAKIFEDIFIKEAVSKKFNADVLRKLTGDDKIDFEKFRTYCFYLTDDYIINHDGYDLYRRVMDCYHRWKEEGR